MHYARETVLRLKVRPAVWAVVAVVAMAASAVGGTGARAESLEEALVRAYSTNANLLAERQQLESTNENVPQALANWRPTVQLSGQASYDRQTTKASCNVPATQQPAACQSDFFVTGKFPNEITTITNTHPNVVGVTIDQPLFRGGRTVAQTAQALNQVRAERAHLVSVEQSVFATVVTDYLTVVEDGALLDLAINNEQVLHQQLEATQVRYRLGELTHTDVRLAEAAYAQAIAARHAAEGQLASGREAYQHDVGEPPVDLKAPTKLPELPVSRDEAISLAAVASPTVVQTQYQVQAAENQIDLVRGQLLPTITLQGTATRTYDYNEVNKLQLDDRSVVVQATIPVYEGGLVYSESRAAQKNVAVVKHQLDDARRTAVQTASQAWDSWQATRLSLQADFQSVKTNEFALAGLEEEEKVGTRTLQDVLIQQEALFAAYTTYVAAQFQELVYKYDLVAGVGRLTAKNLALPVDYYDPDKEFEYVRDKWIGFGTGP